MIVRHVIAALHDVLWSENQYANSRTGGIVWDVMLFGIGVISVVSITAAFLFART